MISIVVPTYNERDNIRRLIPRIFDAVKDAEVIVVDDNSRDGTAAAVKALQKKYRIQLIERAGKQGIGSAYKAGFRAARGSVVVEMDADLSHNPEYLPKLLEPISRGSDIVVGSRYVAGGAIVGWGVYRMTVSRIANTLSRALLRCGVHDVTSGYRAYKRDVLDALDFGDIKSDGYSFQLEILYKLMRRGYKVKEVPIIFEDRKVGESKLARIEMLNYARTVLRLMFYEE